MKIDSFTLERGQSLYEHLVRFNLSESGVHPVTPSELGVGDLGDQLLGYPQTNGSIELRERIAATYEATSAEEVIVTCGTAEANFLAIWSLVEPGDEVVVMTPNYLQIWGLAKSFGARVKPLPLVQTGDRWAPDLAALEQAVTSETWLIAVCNPNNPTGTVMTAAEMDAVVAAADRVGAWLVADEVYRGAEVKGDTTPSFRGRYDRLLATAGLSKAYGLPGLRIGWVAGPAKHVAQLWGYKDYTTIGPAILSDRIARHALVPERRAWLLERTRGILRERLPALLTWVDEHRDFVSVVPPHAAAVAWLECTVPGGTDEMCRRLRDEMSVLIVPGSDFEMSSFIRIGYGCEPDVLQAGLRSISEMLAAVASA